MKHVVLLEIGGSSLSEGKMRRIRFLAPSSFIATPCLFPQMTIRLMKNQIIAPQIVLKRLFQRCHVLEQGQKPSRGDFLSEFKVKTMFNILGMEIFMSLEVIHHLRQPAHHG